LGDSGRIKQILINILNNAIKFTKEGYVKVSIGGRPGETDDEELLILKIEDTGCGIKKEDQKKIFENFRQLNSQINRSAEGTGLGLSITKHLVELMNGKIELESVYGEGTTFTVTIPQKIVDKRTLAEVTDVPVAKTEDMEMFVANNCRALIVDDNQINRKVAKGILKRYQFDLEEAESGFEAIELVKNNEYDIIFMDHMMPEMDGIEAVRIIREECGENGKKPVIIALTANAMDGVKEKFLNSGFQDFLAKPLDRKQLNDVLLKWIPDECRGKYEPYGMRRDRQTKKNEFENINIGGIDIGEAMKYQTGTLAEYEELLRLYCMDGNRKLVLLKKLYQEKDYKDYEIEVHGLKSSSANIGAIKLSAAAKEHEEAAGRGNEEFIIKHFSELMSLYEEQLKHIQSFLAEKEDKTDNAGEERSDIDTETLEQELKEALEQLEKFHSKECLSRVERLQKYNLSDTVAAGLKEIREQLKLYEDDKAEQLLHQMLEWLNKEK
ncbi:MAG: response regulator, partial [Lachnospira sp.]|nr:response regulator [Lachnospira sp.]